MTFVKGQSGNPSGRPKARPFRDALNIELAAAGEDQKALRGIARNLILLAQKEDKDALSAIREIADRTDGKVPQGIVGGDEDDAPVRIEEIRRIIVKPGNSDSGSIPPAADPG